MLGFCFLAWQQQKPLSVHGTFQRSPTDFPASDSLKLANTLYPKTRPATGETVVPPTIRSAGIGSQLSPSEENGQGSGSEKNPITRAWSAIFELQQKLKHLEQQADCYWKKRKIDLVRKKINLCSRLYSLCDFLLEGVLSSYPVILSNGTHSYLLTYGPLCLSVHFYFMLNFRIVEEGYFKNLFISPFSFLQFPSCCETIIGHVSF